MRQVQITIAGLSAYMMNNPASMLTNTGGKSQTIPPPEQEAASKCYWLDEDQSSLVVPSTHIQAALIKGAGRFKLDKHYLATIFIGACHIEPELIPLNTTNYKIDLRTAVLKSNKARILRARPKVLCPWQCTFELHFDPEWLPLHFIQKGLPDVLKTTGNLIGIGDYRVEKKGAFGRFYLVKMELLAQREETPLPEPEIIGFDQFNVVPKPVKKRAKA